jgi:uncharacterized protein YrrD
MDIALDVDVRCLDGVGGEADAVVLNPVTKVVFAIVVRTKGHGHPEVLVPMASITDGSVKQIGVKYTLEELGNLSPFMKKVRVQEQGLDKMDAQALMGAEARSGVGFQDFSFAGAGASEMAEQEAIPETDLAVRTGTPVLATDGEVGEVDRFFVAADTGEIQHLVLLEKHLLSKKNFVVSVDQIDRIGEEAVHLKLSRHEAEQLPRV